MIDESNAGSSSFTRQIANFSNLDYNTHKSKLYKLYLNYFESLNTDIDKEKSFMGRGAFCQFAGRQSLPYTKLFQFYITLKDPGCNYPLINPAYSKPMNELVLWL